MHFSSFSAFWLLPAAPAPLPILLEQQVVAEAHQAHESPEEKKSQGTRSQQSSWFIYKLCFKPHCSCLHPWAKRYQRSLFLCLPIPASLNPQYYSHAHYIYPTLTLERDFPCPLGAPGCSHEEKGHWAASSSCQKEEGEYSLRAGQGLRGGLVGNNNTALYTRPERNFLREPIFLQKKTIFTVPNQEE